MHALLGDFAHCAQAPNLKAAAVGQDGLVPFFKAVQPAKAAHHVQPWAHPQMKGVAQNNLCAHLMQAARHDAFDRAVSAHGHKNGRLHLAVVERQSTTAGVAGGVGF